MDLKYTLLPQFSTWKIVFWSSKRQEYTIENPTLKGQTNSPPTVNIRTMNRRLNPNAIPFTPQSILTSTKYPHDWPPISRTDDPEEHETQEGIKGRSKWIAEWESSTNPNSQNKKPGNFTLRKSFPITEIYQHRQKLESRIKQLSNSVEEKTKRLQLETVTSDLRATIKCQVSLLGKVNTIDHRSSDPCLWQIAAFSTLPEGPNIS